MTRLLDPWFRFGMFWPAMRLAWRYLNEGEDAWVCLEHDRFEGHPAPQFFGKGSVRPFSAYLEGPSEVVVGSWDELQDWLVGCQYVSDLALFQVDDYWQHPRTFEQTRKGDCEDHALWAWRKFVELGLDTELVVGRSRAAEGPEELGGHAWVHVRTDDGPMIVETTSKTKDAMLLSLQEARDHYRPHVSIDGRLRGRIYGGLARTLIEQRRRKTPAPRPTTQPPVTGPS